MKNVALGLLVLMSGAVGCGVTDGVSSETLAASRYTIVVNRATALLTLYSASNGLPVTGFSSLPVITGKNWSTPTGNFRVEYKEKCPTWNHPALGYAGPCANGNPLGRRWIQFNTSWYGIHGNKDESLFQNPGSERRYSSGCIRMRNADVERLYEIVSVGDKVIIK